MLNELHVIFGTGPLGQSVMRTLVAENKIVGMINRTGTANVPSEVEVVSADLYDLAMAITASEEGTVIYQCAQPR